ncbi:DUF1206 domain-containing protein [Gramella sp. AN32]|uniref:DUF1206 domain-containing protein n=1 Tax=Christiangramia antarctica TaxID=2058158 RepID=A0ABW5XBN8_9FLAO|nr:DUF1206 domain-containing protein [Gramella sp. AN32]MCM4157368.1 DUF1206 domain-containing protein [Gramella sp. AN32]
MNSKIEKMARTGYVAKGVVYGITGVLTFMAAFNLGGKTTGKTEVMEFLEKQSFGNVLMALVVIGLLCYVGWRLIQAFKDPENIGNDNKGKVKRVGFFISAIVYLGLAIYGIKKLINAGTGGSSSQNFEFLSGNFGVFVFAVVGLCLLGVSIAKFKKVYSKKFLEKFDLKSISEKKRRKVIKNTGYLGIISRGIIFAILAYFFLRAAYTSNTSDIQTTTDAFSFLRNSSYGAYLMGIVAAGFVCYAIFMFAMAKYRKFN